MRRICVGRSRRICVGLRRRKLDCFKKNIKSISASVLRPLPFLRGFLAILADDSSIRK